MTGQTGVSIVVPNWNHELLLPRSILSALKAVKILRDRQIPAEAVVVDDFSRDGSATLLRRLEAMYYDDGLRLLSFGTNAGLAANRNHALLHCKNRYITFVDADNEVVPENLPLMIETLQQTQAAAAYGNLLIRSPSGDHAHHAASNESFQKRMFHTNYIDSFAVFDRLQVLDAGGYETSFTRCEDYEFWLHLASNGRRIVHVPVVFGYYYILPGSLAEDASKLAAVTTRLSRIFNQVSARKFLATKAEHLRYHPRIGYL